MQDGRLSAARGALTGWCWRCPRELRAATQPDKHDSKLSKLEGKREEKKKNPPKYVLFCIHTFSEKVISKHMSVHVCIRPDLTRKRNIDHFKNTVLHRHTLKRTERQGSSLVKYLPTRCFIHVIKA